MADPTIITGMPNVKVTDDRLIGWLVMACEQWASDYPYSMPKSVAYEMIRRGWMQQELKQPGMGDGEEYVATSFTEAGMQVVALYAEQWGIDMSEDGEEG